MKRLAAIAAITLAFSLTAFACGGDDDDVNDNNNGGLAGTATEVTGDLQNRTAVPGQGGVDAPVLKITEPDNGDTVDDGDITVKVDVDNFKIVDKRGQNPVAGEGHLVYYLDTPNVPTAAGRSASGGPGAVDSSDKSHTWEKVPVGNHSFAVQLVNNDGTPLNPPVFAGTAVVVK